MRDIERDPLPEGEVRTENARGKIIRRDYSREQVEAMRAEWKELLRNAMEAGIAEGRKRCSRELLAMWHATHSAHPHGRSHYHEGYLDALDMASEKFKA